MLFVLKKFIGGMLLPLPFLLLVMAVGLGVLWCSRWQKTGKGLVTAGFLGLLLLSLQPVADRLLAPLEDDYPSWRGAPLAPYIVVPGGGYSWNDQWAPGSNLLNNNLARVVEGVRLWRANRGATLVFTGAAAMGNPVSGADASSKVAESLGVPARAIVRLQTPRDTEEEAAAVKAFIGDQPFLLVSSAAHLPRAMIFFQRQGLHPYPVPANQLAIRSPLNPWERALPAAIWLQHSERAVYERLGQLWQWVTG